MEIKCSVEELKQLTRSFILTEKQEIKIDEEVEDYPLVLELDLIEMKANLNILGGKIC